LTQPESRLQQRIRKALEREFGGWWVKIWAGPFSISGIPDIIGCIKGLFIALEVKTATGKLSPIQIKTINDIITKGGGVAAVVTTPDQACEIVRQAIAGRKPPLIPLHRRRLTNHSTDTDTDTDTD
jgi:hypothetical protein